MKKTILKPPDGRSLSRFLLRRYRRSPLNVAPDSLQEERPEVMIENSLFNALLLWRRQQRAARLAAT